MQRLQMSSVRLVFAATMLMPAIVAAQSTVGAGCVTLDPGVGDQNVSLTQPVAANQWIVVSVATNSTQTQFASVPISDSAGNSYPIYDVTFMNGGTGVLATFAGRAASRLDAGDQITVQYTDNGLLTMQSCVEAAAFPAVVLLPNPSDGYGEHNDFGNTLSVAIGMPTQYGNELVYSAFASAGTPGTMTTVAPAQGLGQLCSSDSSLCLLPAWNYGASEPGSNEGADASSNNSVAWGALAITFQNNDRIFADGFE